MLLLVRHGSVDPAFSGVWLGRTDVPLSPEGLEEAKALARLLVERGERPELVYTSPRQRARATAGVLAGALGVPLVEAQELDEMDLGLLEGRRPEELTGEAEALWRHYLEDIYLHPVPGGEAFRQLEERVLRFAKGLSRDGETYLLVSHTGPLLAILCHVLGLDPRQRPRIVLETGALSGVELEPPVLLFLNEKPGLLDA